MGLHTARLEDMWSPDPTLPLVRPNPCVVVTLQGLTFAATTHGRSRITLGQWSGWHDGVDGKGGPRELDGYDGSAKGDVLFQTRRIHLEGTIHEISPARLAERMEDIAHLLTYPREATMVVSESHRGLRRQVQVQRLDKPLVTQVSPRAAKYSLDLVTAEDWRRVSTTLRTAVITTAGVSLVNAGKIPADVLLRMAGPLTTPGLIWGSEAWLYGASVPSGQTRLVDMDEMVVRDPATTGHSQHLASGAWLELPPGTTVVKRTGTGAGSLTAEWRDTWA